MIQNVDALIRILEKKKALSHKYYMRQKIRQNAGWDIRSLPEEHLSNYNKYDKEIHELRLSK